MLIVLDLDDTLIDTSGCLRKRKLSDALRRLVESGLQVESVPLAMQRLLEIDASAPSMRETFTRFLDEMGGGSDLLNVALHEYYENICGDITISHLQGANDLLQWLYERHQVALVSVGIPAQQVEKARCAQLDLGLFHYVDLISTPDKGPSYRRLIERTGTAPSEVVVCGDKVDVDLVPAKALGCTTVRIRHGRQAEGNGSDSSVDFSISSPEELKALIEKLQSNRS